MTSAAHKSSLAQKLANVRGSDIKRMAERSEAAMDLRREDFTQLLREHISGLVVMARARDDTGHGAIYEMASSIIGTASFVGLDAVSQGAQSLCEMCEIMNVVGWDWDAITVHAFSLQKLVSGLDASSSDARIILEGLGSVLGTKTRLLEKL